MKDLTYISDCSDNVNWKKRHLEAIRYPNKHEAPFLAMLQGWLDYAKAHKTRFKSRIGDDYVLGTAWFRVGIALNDLLNGDLGMRLDCGTLDTIISDNLAEQGYKEIP